MQPDYYQNQGNQYNYQGQGFAPEAPQAQQQNKSKKGTPLIVKIILIIGGIGAFILLAPFIFCFLIMLLGSLA
jgi:hypothetical protein